MPAILQTDKSLLLQRMPYVFDRVAAPDLPLLHHSPRRHNRVRSNDAPLLKISSLHDNRIVTHIGPALQVAGIQSAVVLDNIVPIKSQFSSQASRGGSRSMQDTIIADADIFSESIFYFKYVILLISPRITVPCQIAI